MSLFNFKDTKSVPDVVQEYDQDVKNNALPLIIDNGSFQCRVGWVNRNAPMLVFRNQIAKPRKDRNSKKEENPIQPPQTLIGNQIIGEAMRFQMRTQFDKNVITHFHIQEQIYDYIFTHLGIDTENQVNHPIVLTEAMVNPNYCRQLMSELLFECYNVPSICYGIDSLFSFNYNDVGNSGLIVSLGYSATHVIPVLNGVHVTTKIRRINVGGYHIIAYLHRLLQLKYPVHVNSITISRVEELLHDHCSIAYDYMEALKKWANINYYETNIKRLQLPFTPTPVQSTLSAEQKVEKRKELSRRLAEINARKREEKLAEDEDLIGRLIQTRELYDEDDNEEFELALKEFEVELNNLDELEKLIETVGARIERTKLKMTAIELSADQPIPEKIIQQVPQPPPDQNFDDWISEITQKRTAILEKKQVRRQRRQDLAKRRTAAAQERMRIISKLAGKEKGTDDFGMRDEDWDIYKAISREGGDSDSEAENEKIIEYEEILRHHDLLDEEPQILQGMAEYHQLHISVEAIRAPELLFQPSMMGIQEAGLAETIDYVLKLFKPEEQQQLVDNIFVTGGCSKIPGFQDRLVKELTEIRPFESTFNVHMASDPSLDAWFGARKFAANNDNLNMFQTTRNDYDELGGDYIKFHPMGNRYFKTPQAAPENV